MSLTDQQVNGLKSRLELNQNLTPTSKETLDDFINKKRNVLSSSAFMQQYNTKMRNLRIRDASLGKRKRLRGNLNSAMENNTESVSNGSVNPGKRGRNSPRGPLSAVSGVSNTSNEGENVSSRPRPMNNNGYGGFSNSNNENNLERNAKRRKNNSQLPLVTAAMGAARAAKAAANKAAANKAAAN